MRTTNIGRIEQALLCPSILKYCFELQTRLIVDLHVRGEYGIPTQIVGFGHFNLESSVLLLANLNMFDVAEVSSGRMEELLE